MQMFLIKLFIRLCICKAWSSVGENWKEQYDDKPEVTMLLYLIVGGCLLGGFRQVTYPLWASEWQLSIEVGSMLTCTNWVTGGMLLDLSEPQFPPL